MQDTELGIYVHIPFCKKKCDYCDFVSFCGMDEIIEQYIQCLINEIENKAKQFKDRNVKTIYFGGGTPSYIESKYITRVLENISKNFKVNLDAEITIEANPGTVTKEKIESYKKAGINRISIGLQTTSDALLKEIGRIHTYKEFLDTYKIARNVFDNINVDLMLGLPNQSLKDLKDSLQKVIELNPEHISVYSLILEEKTKMYEKYENGVLNLPDDELERKMYWYVKKSLEKNEYNHYEISNFAKKGYESKHNMDCWSQKQYLGFGINASSYVDSKRFSNVPNINEYIKNIKNNEPEKNEILEEIQDREMQMKEFMLLGLRKIEGIRNQDFYNKFGIDVEEKFEVELKKLRKENLIEKDKIKLTNRGLDLANIVWEEFI